MKPYSLPHLRVQAASGCQDVTLWPVEGMEDSTEKMGLQKAAGPSEGDDDKSKSKLER